MRLVFDVLEVHASPGDTVRFPLSVHNEAAEPVEGTFLLHAEESGFEPGWCRLPAPAFLAAGAWKRDQLTVRLPEEGAVEPGTYHLWLTARTTDGRSTAGTGCTLIVKRKPCARFSAIPQFTLNPDGTVTASLMVLNCGKVQVDASVTLRHEEGWHFEPENPELTLHTGWGPVEVKYTYRPPYGRRASAEDEVSIEIRAEGLLLASISGRLESSTGPSPYQRRIIWVALLILVLLAVLSFWLLSHLSPDPGPVIEPPPTGQSPPLELPLPPEPTTSTEPTTTTTTEPTTTTTTTTEPTTTTTTEPTTTTQSSPDGGIID